MHVDLGQARVVGQDLVLDSVCEIVSVGHAQVTADLDDHVHSVLSTNWLRANLDHAVDAVDLHGFDLCLHRELGVRLLHEDAEVIAHWFEAEVEDIDADRCACERIETRIAVAGQEDADDDAQARHHISPVIASRGQQGGGVGAPSSSDRYLIQAFLHDGSHDRSPDRKHAGSFGHWLEAHQNAIDADERAGCTEHAPDQEPCQGFGIAVTVGVVFVGRNACVAKRSPGDEGRNDIAGGVESIRDQGTRGCQAPDKKLEDSQRDVGQECKKLDAHTGIIVLRQAVATFL